MTRARPSRTTNRLHFTDLEPRRFEDFCLALIFPLHPWADIRHYGRSGGDGGVDIFAREKLEDGGEREWYVQCRRYSRATASTLKKAVDDTLENASGAPDVLLLVIACDVHRKSQEAYYKYAVSKGVSTPLLWTGSILEARLHAERQDLLFTYFGISTAAEARHRDATISRNISMKKKLHRELLKKSKDINWDEARRHPPDKFEYSEMIVHSVDDTSYPDVDEDDAGISGWFKLEVWDFYHNGIEFVVWIDYGIVDERGRWAVISRDQDFDSDKYSKIKMFKLGRIPYRNIVDVDIMGDEYYPGPHIYCRFAEGGEPYEGFRYVPIDLQFPWHMDPDQQFEFNS